MTNINNIKYNHIYLISCSWCL